MGPARQSKDDVNKGEEEEPNNINKVPIPRRSFEPEMLLWFEPALNET